jgi:pimeloyl-ACP methyl ester carboxylesterase
MRTAKSLARLAAYLEAEGFRVLNVGYPSTSFPIDQIASAVHGEVLAFAEEVGTVHFVGFSMGGLVIRAYLQAHRPGNLGRVVMIGTPNNGSEVADLLKDVGLFRKAMGPAGQQLVTDQTSFRHLFGEVGYELGVIAGRNLNPLSRIIFGAPNDGKVSVASTFLPECRDHIVVRRNHTFIPLASKVHAETAIFLRTGHFSPGSARMLGLETAGA